MLLQGSPFFASFGHHPRLYFRLESLSHSARQVSEFTSRIQIKVQQCTEMITLAQAYQSTYANDRRLPAPRFKVGDYIYLSLKNVKTSRPTKKFDHLRAGPWRITQMKTPLVAKIDLPNHLRIDNNFYASLLRPAYIGFESQH